jgi:hypothetical protein
VTGLDELTEVQRIPCGCIIGRHNETNVFVMTSCKVGRQAMTYSVKKETFPVEVTEGDEVTVYGIHAIDEATGSISNPVTMIADSPDELRSMLAEMMKALDEHVHEDAP